MSRLLPHIISLSVAFSLISYSSAQMANPPLTLKDAVAQALAKNFTVKIQQYSVSRATDAVIIAQSVYDPSFGVNWQKTFNKSPAITNSTSTVTGGKNPESSSNTTNLTLTQPIVTGGTVSANYSLNRTANNTIQSLFNPEYLGQIALNVSQPLLQGAGSDYGTAAIHSAEFGRKIAKENFKSAVLTMIYNVEAAYLNLIYTRKQYMVAQDTLKLAQQLLDENIIKRQTGILTDLDVTQAEAGVATAKSQLIGYKQAMQNAEDVLLQTMGEAQFKESVGNVEFPFETTLEVSFDLSYKKARDNGPNLAVIEATIEQYKLTALQTKRNTLPQLNAVAGVGYSSADHSYNDASSNVWNGPGYNWSAGLQLTIPWGMRANRALYRQAMANLESQKVALDQADQTLTVQVRSAVRAVNANKESVAASEATVALSQKQYSLQKAKFDAGLATSYEVLQAQNQLETALNTQIQANVAYHSSIANLHFLEGTSLDTYQVNLN
jgi:outer membrane protein